MAALFPGSEASGTPRLAAVRDGRKAEGLVEGRHYLLDARFADGDATRPIVTTAILIGIAFWIDVL